jgi:hypothetical protein
VPDRDNGSLEEDLGSPIFRLCAVSERDYFRTPLQALVLVISRDEGEE